MIPGRSTFRSISLSAKVFKLPRFLHPRDVWRKFSRMSSTTRPGQSDSIVPFLGLESPKNNEKKQHPKQPQPRNASVNARDTGSIPKGTFPKNFFFAARAVRPDFSQKRNGFLICTFSTTAPQMRYLARVCLLLANRLMPCSARSKKNPVHSGEDDSGPPSQDYQHHPQKQMVFLAPRPDHYVDSAARRVDVRASQEDLIATGINARGFWAFFP